MREHFKDFWMVYFAAAFLVGVFGVIAVTDWDHRRAEANCYDQDKILVDTDAGPRCASLHEMSAAS